MLYVCCYACSYIQIICLIVESIHCTYLYREYSSKSDIPSWLQLAKKYHPDTNKSDSNAHKRFTEVSEAYEVLSDSQQRKQYDMFGHNATGAQAGGGAHSAGGFSGMFPYQSLTPSASPSVCLSVHCLSVSLSLHPYVCFSVSLSLCPSVFSSVCLSVHVYTLLALVFYICLLTVV